jgi:hypothetical protein
MIKVAVLHFSIGFKKIFLKKRSPFPFFLMSARMDFPRRYDSVFHRINMDIASKGIGYAFRDTNTTCDMIL